MRGQLKEDLGRLKLQHDTDQIDDHYLLNKRYNTYLNYVSMFQDKFEVSLHSFELKNGSSYSPQALRGFVDDPGPVFELFVEQNISELVPLSRKFPQQVFLLS